MKARLLAVVLGLTAATGAFANTGNGWYAGANVGYSELDPDGYTFQDDNDVSYGAFVGKDFGNYRIQADVSSYGKLSSTVGTTSLDIKAYGLGVAAIYDFNTSTPFTPYLGARVAVNHFSAELKGTGYSSEDKENRVGFGVLGGVQYAIPNQPLTIDLGVEWNKIASDVTQVGGKLGVAYKF